MAYFANGSEGACFDDQCNRCKYGKDPCPIELVQTEYNYDACKNNVATAILDHLVDDDGTCKMFERFKSDFEVKEEQS